MLPGITTEELSLPGITSQLGSGAQKLLNDYSVKYFKCDIDDVGDVLTLQEIETRGIRGDEVVILEKDKFVFMAQYFIILKYLEKNG